jgi:hypothetical protein
LTSRDKSCYFVELNRIYFSYYDEVIVKTLLWVMLVLFICGGLAYGQSHTFTSNAVIGCSDFTYEGYQITVSGCVLTVNCAHQFASLTVTNNGTVTHTAAQVEGMALTLSGNLVVDSGSTISANGKGYAATTGPGAGVTTAYSGGGGAYGGNGGAAEGGTAYGSVTNPVHPGSGGGWASYWNQPGGAGGGLIQLTAATIALNGTISANGADAGAGGGSGGTIAIHCRSISGTGSLSANGGNNSGGYGGGGGGGRIALYVQSGSFYALNAYGGSGSTHGGAGTVYKLFSPSPLGSLSIWNNGTAGAATPLSGTYSASLSVALRAILLPTAALTIGGDMTVEVNSTVQAVPGQLMDITVGGNFFLSGNSAITAIECGYGTASGPGAGTTINYYAGGGAHGGNGGQGNFGTPGGTGYGSVDHPLDLGSGGGTSTYWNQPGGKGGGAIRLVIQNDAQIEGSITARGGNAQAGGGGAGGSISLTCGRLWGAGGLIVNGGSSTGNGGGGGGGRIFIESTSGDLYYGLQAFGGSGYQHGGAGTIVTRIAGQPLGELLVSNYLTGGASTPLRGVLAHNMILTGFAVLQPPAPLTIMGSLTVQAGARIQATSMQTLDITTGAWLTIDATGSINANVCGFPANQGPGAGIEDPYWGGGAGYGGRGCYDRGGPDYGYRVMPSLMVGSGGGNASYWRQTGGTGGGAIYLRTQGMLTVDGTITANGGPSSAAGGGSGGGICVLANGVTGSGMITANGGTADGGGGCGAGGRIAFYACGVDIDSTHIQVNPGDAGHLPGYGTIFYALEDANHNGLADGCDIGLGLSTDGNQNGVPDDAEISGDFTRVTIEYSAALQKLLLRWPLIAGYTQYNIYGQDRNGTETLLATVAGGQFDATYLLNSTVINEQWTFRVRGVR